MTTTKVMTTSEARADLYDIVDEVKKYGISVTLTKGGKPAAVLMSAAEVESWIETIEVLSDKSLMRQIKKGMDDIKKGRVRSLEDVKKDLGL